MKRAVKALTFLAAEAMGWLVIVAVLAIIFPAAGGFRWDASTPAAAVIPMRSLQLAPCPPWASSLGEWQGANVCVWTEHDHIVWLQRRYQ